MNMLVPVHESRRRVHRGFKRIKLLCDELPQLRAIPQTQPTARHHRLERALLNQAGEIQVQTNIHIQPLQLHHLAGSNRTCAHKAGRMNAPHLCQAQNRLIHRIGQTQIIDIEGDFFHETVF